MKLPDRAVALGHFLEGLARKWLDDSIGDVAGAVTFSAVLALFPFLLFIVAAGSLFIDTTREAAIVDSLSRMAPEEVTHLVAGRLRALSRQPSVGLLTGSIALAIWSVSSGITSLMAALNTCYGVHETRSFWKTRGIALGMTFFAVALSLFAGAVAVALPSMMGDLGWLGRVLLLLRLPAAALVLMSLWAVTYYVLPDLKQPFRLMSPGAVVGVLLWLTASWGFSEYVSHFGNYELTYGTLGGFTILLLWMWISAQTMLLGAEINALIDGAGKGTQPSTSPVPARRP